MEAHQHYHSGTIANEHWAKRHRWLTYVVLVILAYFLFIEHREHVLPFLPYLLILACPFLHIFMHGGHGHQEHSAKEKEGNS